MTDEPSDQSLLQRFIKGDADALGVLASRYEPALLGLARSLLNHRADLAADAVQDTWLRVIRSAHTYSAQSTLKTWLYRILINRCHDLRAQAGRHSLPALNAEVAERHVTPAPSAAQADLELQRALESLPDDRRTILLLCYHRGMTHDHAAAVLDIPLGTLKSRLHASLTELRTILIPCDRHERSNS